ncbi:hypothetical protein [Amycolatopsis thermoflava]|uniref:hypothetical protein n=1 Tax=Amycolatopsis thermoflava TaxID=84480 RepID=UPI003659E829
MFLALVDTGSAEGTINTHFTGDAAVLFGRSLRHITRSLDTIITTAIMPIAFTLLFAHVFGRAIRSGSDSYVNYLPPDLRPARPHPRLLGHRHVPARVTG